VVLPAARETVMVANVICPNIPSGHGKTHIDSVYLDGVVDDGGGIIISLTKNGGRRRYTRTAHRASEGDDDGSDQPCR